MGAAASLKGRCLCNRDTTPLTRGLLPSPYVQFWETENSGRLDDSRRRGHRRDIRYLVDASDLRIVNAPQNSGEVNERYGDITPVESNA